MWHVTEEVIEGINSRQLFSFQNPRTTTFLAKIHGILFSLTSLIEETPPFSQTFIVGACFFLSAVYGRSRCRWCTYCTAHQSQV